MQAARFVKGVELRAHQSLPGIWPVFEETLKERIRVPPLAVAVRQRSYSWAPQKCCPTTGTSLVRRFCQLLGGQGLQTPRELGATGTGVHRRIVCGRAEATALSRDVGSTAEGEDALDDLLVDFARGASCQHQRRAVPPAGPSAQ